jgi:excisionase family DNA binding protein
MSNRADLLGAEEDRMNDSRVNLLLKPEEAAEVLAIGRTQVYALIASGQLASVQIGRLRRVPYAACQQYVERLQKRD